jgi:hypothetical protein
MGGGGCGRAERVSEKGENQICQTLSDERIRSDVIRYHLEGEFCPTLVELSLQKYTHRYERERE